MQKETTSATNLSLSRAIFALAWAALIFFHLHFFLSTAQDRLTYIPDDGFYYLLPARNFFKLGLWSFDKGATVTSGFHLAWAYFLACLSPFFSDSAQFLYAALACGALFTHAAIALGAWALRRSPLGLLVLALLLSSVNSCLQSISLMEWPLAVLAAGGYALLLAKGSKSLVPIFILGILGSLIRSDFGLWPAALAAAAMLLGSSTKSRSLAGLLGAACGVGIIFIHNWLMCGAILQGSAQVKLFSAKVHGPNALMAARTLIHLLTGIYALPIHEGSVPFWGKLAALALVGSAAFWIFFKGLWPKVKERGESEASFFIASILALAGYHLLYCFDGAVQLWYTSNQAIPCGILMALSLAAMPALLRRGALIGVLGMTAWNIQRALSSSQGPFPYCDDPASAGLYLKGHASELTRGKIGSWNVGVLNYVQGGDIINLDGLMNNEIVPYITQGQAACYIAKKGIAYIVDTDFFVDRNRISLGIADGKLEAAFKSKRRISENAASPYPYYLYEIDLKKIAAGCRGSH